MGYNGRQRDKGGTTWVNKGFRNCENRRFFSRISPSVHGHRIAPQWGAIAAAGRPFLGARPEMKSARRRRCQTVCKPGSVHPARGWMAIHLGRPLPDASRNRPGRRLGNPPAGRSRRAAPIWFCSRWGLPCRRRRRRRGALLPHPFTLTRQMRTFTGRFAFCGTFPGVAPAGRYPAPCFHGARTFLPRTKARRRPSDRLAILL